MRHAELHSLHKGFERCFNGKPLKTFELEHPHLYFKEIYMESS